MLAAAAITWASLAACVSVRRLWPVRRTISRWQILALLTGTPALVLAILPDPVPVIRYLAIVLLGAAVSCEIAMVLAGICSRRRSGAHFWRTRRRRAMPTSHLVIWVDDVGAGLVAAMWAHAIGQSVGASVGTFVGSGLASAVVQSVKLENRKSRGEIY